MFQSSSDSIFFLSLERLPVSSIPPFADSEEAAAAGLALQA
jgi:hypothetical protein